MTCQETERSQQITYTCTYVCIHVKAAVQRPDRAVWHTVKGKCTVDVSSIWSREEPLHRAKLTQRKRNEKKRMNTQVNTNDEQQQIKQQCRVKRHKRSVSHPAYKNQQQSKHMPDRQTQTKTQYSTDINNIKEVVGRQQNKSHTKKTKTTTTKARGQTT